MRKKVAPVGVIFLLSACTSLAPGYNLEAYKTATSLKAQVQALAAESADDFSAHATEVKDLTLKLQTAYEYAAGLPDNAIVTEEWRRMADPAGHLYGGFVKRWQAAGRFSPTEARDKHDQLGHAFDRIICAEAEKKTSVTCAAATEAAK